MDQQPERIAPIQSVERAIWILQCIERHRELHINEISELLQINKSTVTGLIRTLQAYKLVAKNPQTGKYALGHELFRLGSSVETDLRSLVKPYMDQLSDEFHETVNFMLYDGDAVLRLVKLESLYSLQNATKVGQRQPLHLSSGGKAILATFPDAKVRSILENTEFVRYTENTLVTVKQVMAEVEQIRKDGYAIDNEETERGLVCIGVAICSNGQAIGSLTVSGPTFRINGTQAQRIVSSLKKYRLEIESRLTASDF